MNNDTFVVKGYTPRQYSLDVRRNTTEELPEGNSFGPVGSLSAPAAVRLSDASAAADAEYEPSLRALPEVYDTVPRYFQADRWPEHLRVCCSYCSVLVARPWPICTGVEGSRGVPSFRVESIYCNPCHIKRAFMARPRDRVWAESYQATLTVVGLMVHKRVPDLPVGLEKARLAKFCGAGGMREADFLQQNQQQWEEFLANL